MADSTKKAAEIQQNLRNIAADLSEDKLRDLNATVAEAIREGLGQSMDTFSLHVKI